MPLRHMRAFNLFALLLPAVPAHAAPPDVLSLVWLAGCWQSDGAEAGSGENGTASRSSVRSRRRVEAVSRSVPGAGE